MKIKSQHYLQILSIFILIATLVGCAAPHATSYPPAITQAPFQATNIPADSTIHILVDDFKPQAYQGDSVYFYNRLEGDRGAINNSILEWGDGQVTTTISDGNSWGGVWMSLNHPIREGFAVNFSALLPKQILPQYQSWITAMSVHVVSSTADRTLKLELKNGNDLSWSTEVPLRGEAQDLNFDLPPLGGITQFVWVLDHATPGDFVILDRISLTATTQVTDTATAAFVWSYGMVLNNWNPETGLVRDKAKDASGEFDAIQSTGSLAAATALAEQLGVIDSSDAIQIVNKISRTLLFELPRYHGLWPHWVQSTSEGKFAIVPNTEWSSVDTVIAALALLEAQSGLELDTSDTEEFLESIDWNGLLTPNGLSHGYTYAGDLIPYAWDVFGGESWLVEYAYSSVTNQVAPLEYSSPPTANGSGFIDELAWLFVPPPTDTDYWGTDWGTYRQAAAEKQIEYFSTRYPSSCFASTGLFGLSAGEVPNPSAVDKNNIYQAYGIGGAFASVNDGSALGDLVVAPHYSAMIASLSPEAAIRMWKWLIENGFFSPLNNVESLTFPTESNCDPSIVQWNQLKGSWNLALQTLGWGTYLAQRNGSTPILWQAVDTNRLLKKGYLILGSPVSQPAALAITSTPTTVTSFAYTRECESPDAFTIGQTIDRSNASGLMVHGQFGTVPAWPAKAGYVLYNNINLPQTEHLLLELRYSKHNPSTIPILIYMDDESSPRAKFYPQDQGDWNNFTSSGQIALGAVKGGIHAIKFYTEGQEYGVADLDKFTLTAEVSPAPSAIPTQRAGDILMTETPANQKAICDGKPYTEWGLPGTYRYKHNGVIVTVTVQRGEPGPSLKINAPPGIDLSSTADLGTEKIKTALGTFQATVVGTESEYNILTGRLDYYQGVFKVRKWYVCGYGLVKLTSLDRGIKTPGNNKYSSSDEFILISFSPLPSN